MEKSNYPEYEIVYTGKWGVWLENKGFIQDFDSEEEAQAYIDMRKWREGRE